MQRILLSLPFLLLTLSPSANAQTVSVPNTLTNGSVADADAMNDNFAELEFGVNAALTTGSVAVPNTFTNGTTADADQVNANFTELETGVNTALANRATDCAGAGGTWNPGTSTCTAASNYNSTLTCASTDGGGALSEACVCPGGVPGADADGSGANNRGADAICSVGQGCFAGAAGQPNADGADAVCDTPTQICPSGVTMNIPDPNDCQRYYICIPGATLHLMCLSGYFFDPSVGGCVSCSSVEPSPSCCFCPA